MTLNDMTFNISFTMTFEKTIQTFEITYIYKVTYNDFSILHLNGIQNDREAYFLSLSLREHALLVTIFTT